jgi:hypothetical protein
VSGYSRSHAFQRVSDSGQFGNRVHPFMYGTALPVPVFVSLHFHVTGVFSDGLVHGYIHSAPTNSRTAFRSDQSLQVLPAPSPIPASRQSSTVPDPWPQSSCPAAKRHRHRPGYRCCFLKFRPALRGHHGVNSRFARLPVKPELKTILQQACPIVLHSATLTGPAALASTSYSSPPRAAQSGSENSVLMS